MDGPVRIIGVGNPLMGDDGFGIAVVERLSAAALHPGVEVIDGGTGGITLLALMEGAGRVIVIDALDFGGAPGAILRLCAERLESSPEKAAFSLHQTGLAQVLALGRELGSLPPVLLLGVQPASVCRRLGLSPAVAAAVNPVIDRIQEELSSA